MSVCYSANLVYGVMLTPEERIAIQERPDWDEICDNWVHNSNLMWDGGDIVIGIQEDGVEAGEATELGTIHDPRSCDIDDLVDILDELGIDRDPTWHLMCSIS